MGNRHCPRKGSRDVCLVPAGELAGLIETAHLRRSPRNGRHLPAAVRRAEGGKTEALNLDDSRLEILDAKKTRARPCDDLLFWAKSDRNTAIRALDHVNQEGIDFLEARYYY